MYASSLVPFTLAQYIQHIYLCEDISGLDFARWFLISDAWFWLLFLDLLHREHQLADVNSNLSAIGTFS